MISIHKAHEWPLIKLMRYMPDIGECFQKLENRFPGDITVESLFRDYLSGNKVLWIVLDGEELLSVAMTNIRTVEATGKKIASVMDLAGKDRNVFSDELNQTLEAWAKENGADTFAIEGRPGWDRIAKKYGYTPYAVQWRKEVN